MMTMAPRIGFTSLILLLLIHFLDLNSSFSIDDQRITSRRSLLAGIMTGGMVSASTSLSSWAACLPGDLSPDCIGVYKVPLDDGILPYIRSAEELKKYAPDVKYVPIPSNGKDLSRQSALEILQTQRLAAEDIRSVVLSGRLEEAGIKVLNLLPKVNAAGNALLQMVVVQEENSATQQLRLSRLQNQFQELQSLWGGIDVLMGQGLRGELGVSAVAQLQILKEVDEGLRCYDDFLALVGSSVPNNTKTENNR